MTRRRPSRGKLRRNTPPGGILPNGNGKPRGGTTKFREEILNQVFALARARFTNAEIAEFYTLDVNTIDYWIRTKPEFEDALRRGRMEPVMKAASSLHQRANGYNYVETKREVKRIQDKQTGEWVEVEVGRTETTRHVLPHVGACVQILASQYGDRWAQVMRAQTEVNLTGNLTMRDAPNIDQLMELLTPKEREMVRSIGVKQLMAHAARDN